MLNKNELKLVNEIVKTFDDTVEVIATANNITVVEVDPSLNEVYTDKAKFMDEMKEIIKTVFNEVDRKKAVSWLNEIINIKYNHLKNIVLAATERGSFNDIDKHIKLLDDFINLYCYDALSLKQSQSIQTYRDIIINCKTVSELHETLKDIYYMKQNENIKNNNYIISTIKDVESDKEFFKNEYLKNSEYYDPEVDEHLAKYKMLNRKFMYIAG